MDQEMYKCQGSLLVPADYKLPSAWRERLVAGKTINIVLTRKRPAFPDRDPRFTLHGEKSLPQDEVLFEVWLNNVKSYLIRADSWHEIVTCSDRCFALSFVEDEQFRVFFQKLEEVLKSLNKYQVCSVEQARESIVVMKANRIPPPKPPRTRLSTSKDQELPVLPAVQEAIPDVAESSPDESEPVVQSVAKKQSDYEMLIRQGTGRGSSDATGRASINTSIGKDASEPRRVSKLDPKFLENLVQITKGTKPVLTEQNKQDSIPVSVGKNNRLRETSSPQQVTGEVGKEPSTQRLEQSNFKTHGLIPETKRDLIDTLPSNESLPQIRHQQTPALSSTDNLKSRSEPKSAQSSTTATQCGPSLIFPTGQNLGNQETVKRGSNEKPKKSPKPQGQRFNLPNTFTEFSVPDSEDWACSRCTLINSSSRSNCDACGNARSTDQTPYLVYILPASAVSWMMSSSPESAGPDAKSWTCSICSQVNKEDQLTCGSCQTWTCLHCTLHNTNDMRICSVCTKTRDYA